MQLCNADDLGISQPSVSHKPNHQRALLEELTELSSKLVKAEIIPLISSNSFSGFLWTINNYTGSKPTSWHAGMHGVVGAVDGTHIQIIAPSKDEDVFVNRKKVHTSTRRLFLMQLLTFLMLLQSGLQGLPMIRWLSLQDVLTPYLSPQPGAQLKYNMQVITQITISPMRHTKIHKILWREDVITVITVCVNIHNRYGLLFKVLNSGDMLIG
ncbi:hypothetical protein N1851_023094 [Merluccius polli]|uniref:DDE Tnp4 domain-containing protein n=1 Tax=Merluccius polli TaxID=89951 RepID=A0AA47NXW9_MERPO|nr:hypothetical protein N1851_023094 [Merluccius polli]